MGGWLLIDSFGSFTGGAGGNVLLNLGFAVLFLAPALWPEPDASPPKSAA